MQAQRTIQLVDDYPVHYKDGEKSIPFPIKFRWQKNLWFELFEKHVDFIVQDIERARAEDRLIIYLSCPISSRNGSHSRTNVEIAIHTAERLKEKMGSRFWILNPTLYQMHSKEGTGLIKRHAEFLSLKKKLKEKIDVEKLSQEFPVEGGDYMRMWTRVLVEDRHKNLGGRFDAFYFVGPNDVWDFFMQGGAKTVTDGVEEYFSRKIALDPDFANYFSEENGPKNPEWKKKRDEFFRFYSLRASTSFSKGAHDEYLIWVTLNKLRVKHFGIGYQIPGYFDSRQFELPTYSQESFRGYALD